MDKTNLVLGATGKIGRRLVPILKRERGAEVRPTSRSGDDGYALFDWHKPQTWHAAVAKADSVFLIGPEMVEDPSDQIGAFLSLAGKEGVEKVVAVSSLGVTFPTEPANSGRLKVEAVIKASGLNWTILRPGGFHQNFSEGFLRAGCSRGHGADGIRCGKSCLRRRGGHRGRGGRRTGRART